ncbi:adenosylcobinamide amidohydrolase [Bacillus sp. 03113]|uniref:adenosylcobinamide amidohydrolase n=1 Tax=Bacillus sp. 03113 TaxID=2578211 RepID=UPI0011414200|nr:adenosylcobinamide amidohydrolase [Bacillus sp. 03113]
MLKLQNVSGGYTENAIIKDVSFYVQKGELFGILGPNGSGKTTLLKLLSGILPNQRGSIVLKNRLLHHYTPKELAKIMAVLPQLSSQAFSYTVKETVALGRYAHQKGWFRAWGQEDEAIVQQVLEQTNIKSLERKLVQELSGGERQRVFLAQALAQEPEILLLDEPTNHLDLSFQKELLDLLKQWTIQKKLTVISIFHDLNLAGLYCDRLLLLENGEINIDDCPNEVLKEERIKNVYRTEVKKLPHPMVAAPQMVIQPDTGSMKEVVVIDESCLVIQDEWISLKAPSQLRTMSSGVLGAGTGWYQYFVNRHVRKDYQCDDFKNEMASFLKNNGFEPSETVGMMTAVVLEDVSYRLYKGDSFSLFVVVTAGAGNAVDASKGEEHVFSMRSSTINTWLFINGELSEEAFIQSIMTATESKAKVLQDLNIIDKVTNTVATGTSTDSILVAATQQGKKLDFAGTITPLGKLIGKGVYECTKEALQMSRRRFLC